MVCYTVAGLRFAKRRKLYQTRKPLANRKISWGYDSLPAWISLLEDLMLALSDQQLLTGLLVMICSLAFFSYPGVTNFLFSALLGYFSSVTHAASLTTLSDLVPTTAYSAWVS